MPAIRRSRARWAGSPGRCIWSPRPSDVARLKVQRPGQVAYVTQTTLSVDDTRDIIDALKRAVPVDRRSGHATTSATPPRTASARCGSWRRKVDLMLVVGAPQQLQLQPPARDRPTSSACPAYLIEDAGELDPGLARRRPSVGITAGASAPEVLVQEVVADVAARRRVQRQTLPGIEENVQFRLPSKLEPRRVPKSPASPSDRGSDHGHSFAAICSMVGAYVVEAAPARREALSAGADAGAVVPLQSGLRRLRQDRLSRRRS